MLQLINMKSVLETLNNGDREINLKRMIGKAYKSAMDIDNYYELKSLENERTNTLDIEKERRYQVLKKEMKECGVVVYSVIEYKQILDLLPISKEQVYSILSHENAHANVAEQAASIDLEGFSVSFLKNKEGNVTIAPSIKVSTDPSFPRKQILKENIMMTEAPANYGDKLSTGDKEILRHDKDELAGLA